MYLIRVIIHFKKPEMSPSDWNWN